MKKLSATRFATLLTAVALILSSALHSYAQEKKKPRLVLQITVDQLRGDLPHRFYSEFGDGGFRYLYESGVVYEDAFHRHANTETIVGHTTLATGADPSTHGMVANVWLDRETGQLTYNVQDARYPLLSKGAGVDKESEIDPTQRLFSVKDRGAIPMAGHAGKAFWFSKATGEFVTSTYYYKDYPKWAKDWNAKRIASSYAGKSWELLHDRSTYQFGDRDDMPYETNFPGYGQSFHSQASTIQRIASSYRESRFPKSCGGVFAAKLFFLIAGGLNLHELPAETPFDAKIAVSDVVVKRRGHANDLARPRKNDTPGLCPGTSGYSSHGCSRRIFEAL